MFWIGQIQDLQEDFWTSSGRHWLCGLLLLVEDIKRKWKYLRSSHGRELKKFKTRTSGSSADSEYKSRWCHFNSMKFLIDVMEGYEHTDSLNDPEMQDDELDHIIISATSSHELQEMAEEDLVTTEENFATAEVEKFQTTLRKCHSMVKVMYELLKKPEEQRPKDNIDSFLNHVNISLRKLPEHIIQKTMGEIQKSIASAFENVSQPS